ncbi:MBL fold metallo-hydrolase [Rhodobacter sp. NTK016B]|uniref:MBL fold metallo-hydrolase n=1 Tax=Rhodobacter sp. NTK016B TaxID=2759676 RepID=UPI001A8DB141|nr:MBL fold metallo-hydrolase [Rhodobacter sp. NTK016B]MBN8290895.1 MBL fold metallo-hydrolase [Rhodobacter sp. NTK016B]
MTTASPHPAEQGIHFPHEAPPEKGQAIEVAPGILWMRMSLPMQLDHVNVYALDDGDGWTLVDTGFATKSTKRDWQALIAGPLAAKPVRRLIVTHHHPDHIGLAGWFQTEYGVELVTTRTAWLFARMLMLDAHTKPVPETVAYWRGAGVDEEEIARRMAERPFNFADVVDPMPLGFTRIAEGDEIVIGGRNWIVRCGDGHAPEHATFWSLDDDLVIGGDQLLPGISANLGVYATEPGADPVAEWIRSCKKFGEIAEDRHYVLPGHKLPFTGLPLRLRQMVENHQGALSRLEQYLSEPRTAAECFLPLFKREITDSAAGMALVESVAHLNHLLKAGRATRQRDARGVWLWQRAA